ncbi:ATP-binding protein [Marinospirillum sp.]|uniref:sensor histidine kinase n=1 Tax=Marinospirillum sp. TaxID=2183934 RepID=UPI002870486E|nr:ATP-binding protein [Marinospirillum sp.]MDR9468351.1 ATP-binding protein [Marinospirillum sp.]
MISLKQGSSFWLSGCLLLLCLVFSNLVLAESPLRLGENFPYHVLPDPAGQYSLDQAHTLLLDQEKTVSSIQRDGFARGYTHTVYWLKTELPAAAFNGKDGWLEVGPNFADDIRLYLRPENSQQDWTLLETGDLQSGRGDLDYRNPVFVLPPPPVEANHYELIVRLQSASSMLFFANLWSPEAFMNASSRATAFWSFYFGLAGLSSLLALLLAILLRTRLLWSATALTSGYLLVACVQGYISWLFPATHIPWQHYATSFFSLTSFAVLIWMSSETLDLRHKLPWVYRGLNICSLLILLLTPLIFVDAYALAVSIKVVIFLGAVAAFFASIPYLWIRHSYDLRELGLALVPAICIIGSLFGVFSVFGWIAFSNDVYVIWQYLLIFNMLFVMLVGVYRIRKTHFEEIEKQRLTQSLQVEREASFHQRQFLGMVGHEFRTPLAVISGTLENLVALEPETDHPRITRYQKIQRATDRLNQLTDNCLADARLSADNLYVDLQPVNFIELVFSATSLVHLSDTHRLSILFQGKPLPASIPHCKVNADAALLRIAISNILDNAVKYSIGGTITLELDCQSTTEVCLQVSDQGAGVETELDSETIFERYRRGQVTKQGAGLGLFVARQIVRAHQGELQLVSSSAQGSCFAITLPKNNNKHGADNFNDE